MSTLVKKSSQFKQMHKDWRLYTLMAPGILFFIFFKYVPMWGILMSFQNYSPHRGFWNSDWAGFKHYIRFFSEPTFFLLFKNTIILAVLNLVFYFPLPIILALLLNELRNQFFKRSLQTLVYIPHFISWVVVAGIYYTLLTTEGGVVNMLIEQFGGERVHFLFDPQWFRPLVVSQVIWKEAGWGTIIILAALSGVDPSLYEASRIDGANRWRQMWHVTLPAIRSVIVILLILRLGNILEANFEQIFLMLNPLNQSVGEIYDTYVYTAGLMMGQFSYSTAVNVFQNFIGLLLIIAANQLAKKFGEEGVF